ncbi:hypothetical protein CC80DRAFT_534884 [Byssothecium circinans]|uniref:C3H1-type domain-containing protein n=1 Tax=Byssothecium circinans TaxID=147558 RepID=A0A6A5TW74_9PLEO|nr:hypothetical protein CC80DRAFT_534884 [Byssothecium circinans]
MLGDGKLDSLDTRLEQYKLNNTANQNELQTILKEYSQLLDSYKTLKLAHDGRINGVKVEDALKVNPRSEYILVLVDGNGYIFNDELVRDKEEGGMRAARMLNDAVEKYLRESLPHAKDARLVVRVYADITNLSKQLAKSKLIGLEKRSLCPFTAGFTRAIGHFDYVDALDEEGTKFKIRETFKAAATDDACSHILYAACHDSGYLSQLVPYSGHRSKITLVQGAGWNAEFHQFGLNVTQFPTIFRWSELASMPPSSTKMPLANKGKTLPVDVKGPLKHGLSHPAHGNGDWRAAVTFGSNDALININALASVSEGSLNDQTNGKKKSQPCKFFNKGFCRFGDKCNFLHPGDAQPQQSGIAIDRSNVSDLLPTHIVPGFIPLNKDNQRLDVYIREPTQEEWIAYNALFHNVKPCNNHHLQGMCTRFACPYDHSPLEPTVRHCLEYVVKCSVCPRKGACRTVDCIQGHLCQKNGCTGQEKGCKMKADLHNVDPRLSSLVPVEDEQLVHDDLMGVPVQEDMMSMW